MKNELKRFREFQVIGKKVNQELANEYLEQIKWTHLIEYKPSKDGEKIHYEVSQMYEQEWNESENRYDATQPMKRKKGKIKKFVVLKYLTK